MTDVWLSWARALSIDGLVLRCLRAEPRRRPRRAGLLDGGEVVVGQLLDAPEVTAGIGQVCLVLLLARDGLIDRRLVGPWVDGPEHVAGAHVLALAEPQLLPAL